MPPNLADLERVLRALANENRLQLLFSLQDPKGYSELQLPPPREDGWGSDERSISRQAVRAHLRELMAIGVVEEAPTADGTLQWVVNHARLFGALEQMRALTTVRPRVEVGGETADLERAFATPDVGGPHLVLVRGVEEGRAFPLVKTGEWTIGRGPACAIRLDYDPFISGEHARILQKGPEFFLADVPANKNGTYLNWRRLSRGALAPLKSGDVVGLGMSLLVFRE